MGTVQVRDCVGEGATKGEYSIIGGRIQDLAWDSDSQRIIAVGNGKDGMHGKFKPVTVKSLGPGCKVREHQ